MTSGKMGLIACIYFACISLANPAEDAGEVVSQNVKRAPSSSQMEAIQSQTKLVQSLQRETTQAELGLERTMANRPNWGEARYSADDKLQLAKFNEDMAVWETEVNRLTSVANTKQAQLSQEQSRLDNLQSRNSGARGNDEERRRRALEGAKEQQGKEPKKK